MISLCNHRHLYYFVHTFYIKAGREVVEDLSLRRIDRIFRFFNHWRAINKTLVRSVSLNMSQQNHSNVMISCSNHHHTYYFVYISSIKAGKEVVEYFSFCRINRRFLFCCHCRAINTALVFKYSGTWIYNESRIIYITYYT